MLSILLDVGERLGITNGLHESQSVLDVSFEVGHSRVENVR